MFEYVIRGGEVLDGTGRPAVRADVAIASGRIARVGTIDEGELPPPERVLDASGCCVTPGFIDAHSHSDLTLLVHAAAESSLCQGITTEVAGSCGWSMYPYKAETGRGVLRGLLEGLTGSASPDLGAWFSFADYVSLLKSRGTGTNLYPILGQSLVRAHVVGTAKRPATSEEVAAMRAIVREAMANGCRGLSTGRGYLPGGNANTDEIVALCEEIAPFDGLYTSHVKNEGPGLIAAVEEVIEIGRRAGVKVQVSHHKAIGPANFGRVEATLGLVERARQDGVDANSDVYPYDFAQVFRMRDGLFRNWLRHKPEEVLRRLSEQPGPDAHWARAARRMLKSADNYLLVRAPGREEVEGLTITAASADAGLDAIELCRRLLLDTRLGVLIAARMCEDDVRRVLAHPLTMVGTDAFAIDGDAPPEVPLHPRHYGTFPRVAGHYARDVGLFGLPEAVRKVTGLPAGKLGLVDRGRVAPGCFADLVVFDPLRVRDRATAGEPCARPEGISAVLVNGEVAWIDGRPSGARAGMVLLGQS
ncbi:MAG: D-aminoacylase [Bacillota bacterium]|nr:D-aminoacylase [Bacillota bacterium]